MDVTAVKWIPVAEPPQPDTPYGWYLVWLRGPEGKIKDGVADFAHYSRGKASWTLRHPHEHLVITHWAVSPIHPIVVVINSE